MKNLRFLQFFLVVAFCLGAAFIAQAQDETMTNEEVISLTKAGLNKSLIVDKIRTSKSRFDLSTDALIKLKKAGVNDDVVAEMLRAKGGVTTVDRTRGVDGLTDKAVVGPKGGVSTVDRSRGADGAVDSVIVGPRGGTTTVDRSLNADGTVNRTVTKTPAPK